MSTQITAAQARELTSPFNKGHRLRPDAARAWERAVKAFGKGVLLTVGIIFSGDKNPSTESIILNKTGVKMIGRIEQEPYFDANVIADYADAFRENLLAL